MTHRNVDAIQDFIWNALKILGIGRSDQISVTGCCFRFEAQTLSPFPDHFLEDVLTRIKKRKLRVQSTEHVSERVREQMQQTGIGSKAMAEKLGISESYYSRILTGHRPWTLQLLLQVATELNVTVESLDPECLPELNERIHHLELRDIQLPALYTFVQKFSKIRTSEDLDALSHIIQAFAARQSA